MSNPNSKQKKTVSGKNSLIDEKARVTFQRLLLSKQLYLHGLDHSNRGGKLNKMIAVHNFHNAIEITLQAIISHLGIQLDKPYNTGFEDLLKYIEKHHKGFNDIQYEFPSRPELIRLNKLRNSVQHDAVEPPDDTMGLWRVLTQEFLEKGFNTYFNQEFDSVSAIDMIDDEDLKKFLKLSELSIKENNYNRSLLFSHTAFLWAVNAVLKSFPSVPNIKTFSTAASFGLDLDFNMGTSNLRGEVIRVLKRVFSDADKTRENLKELERYVVLLSSGVSLIDYKLFQSFRSFSIRFTPSGDLIIYKRREIELNEETTKWSHEFVINTIVHWQVQGLKPNVSDMSKKAAKKLIENYATYFNEDEA